jgi:hypothetical protein
MSTTSTGSTTSSAGLPASLRVTDVLGADDAQSAGGLDTASDASA